MGGRSYLSVSYNMMNLKDRSLSAVLTARILTFVPMRAKCTLVNSKTLLASLADNLSR